VVFYHFSRIPIMNSIYPNPALGLVTYFPAGRLALLVLPATSPDVRPGDRMASGDN
jgi:hypothetical protein